MGKRFVVLILILFIFPCSIALVGICLHDTNFLMGPSISWKGLEGDGEEMIEEENIFECGILTLR